MGLATDEASLSFLARAGLFFARFCSSAWIGAASLFVVVGVTEVTRGGFDAVTKDMLVAIRFPAFYLCGVSLIGTAWVGTLLAGSSKSLPAIRRVVSLILFSIVLAIMAWDYFYVYQPLLEMVTPPGREKTSLFAGYHTTSKWINMAGLAVCLFATILVNWSGKADGRSSQEGDPRIPHSD